MDPRFPFWIRLRIRTEADARHRVSKVKKLLESAFFSTEELQSDLKLHDKIVSHYMKQSRELYQSVQDDDDADGDEGDDDGPILGKGGGTRAGTMSHDIEALVYYLQFRGIRAPILDKLRARLVLTAKFLQQAETSLYIQDCRPSAQCVEGLFDALRSRQKSIDARIARWLQFGILAENKETLRKFGQNEMRPFIELCLRYGYLPMAASRLSEFRVDFKRNLPAMSLYGDEVREFMGTHRDLLLLDGTKWVHVFPVAAHGESATSKSVKLVTHPLSEALSLYIFFYHRHCKSPDASRLFWGATSTESRWRHVRKDVREYVSTVVGRDLVGELGLDGDYRRTSMLQWLARRACYFQSLHQIKADVTRIQLGFKNDNKYYTGFRQLQNMRTIAPFVHAERVSQPLEVREITGLADPDPLVRSALQDEMRYLSGHGPFQPHSPCSDTVSIDSSSEWVDVLRHPVESMFSPEWRQAKPKHMSFKRYQYVMADQ